MDRINRRQELAEIMPDVPASFHNAICGSLDAILAREGREREPQPRRTFAARRAVGWALAAALLLAGAFGIAEGIRRGVFDFLLGRSDALPEAARLVQADAAEKRVGRTSLRVTETVYDGQMVRFVMSVQNDAVKRPITEGEAGGDGDFGKALAEDGVTVLHSFDWFSVNGAEYGMTGGSGGATACGDHDGEALVYFELLLSQGAPAPEADFTLGVPVCGADAAEERQLFIPVRYLAKNLAKDLTPPMPFIFGQGESAYTVAVTEAKLSPIRNALELRADAPDIADGDAAWELIAPWSDIALVDENGAELGNWSTAYSGLPADETDDMRHLLLRVTSAPLENYPARLFIAPMRYDDSGERRADERLMIELKTEEK